MTDVTNAHPSWKRRWQRVSLRWRDNASTLLLVAVVMIAAVAPSTLWPGPWLQPFVFKTSCIALVLWTIFSVHRYLFRDEKIALTSLLVWWTLLWGGLGLVCLVLGVTVFNVVQAGAAATIAALLVDRATAVLALLAIMESARTLYAWHQRRRSPELDHHRQIVEALGLPMELDEARRHRAVEFGILACVLIIEVALWRFAHDALVVRWLGHAATLASIVLVGRTRVSAYRRLMAAHERALRLLNDAIAAKSERDNPSH